MSEKIKNIFIGLFIVGAITVAVVMILFLNPKIGDGKKTLQVRFANISGITIGTRVTFAGKPVGEVISIHEVKNARNERTDESGRVYLYELTLKIDSSVDVYDTDDVAIKTSGLMGERSVAILPKVAVPGKPSHIVDHEVIYANSIDSLENAFNQVSKVANQMENTISHIDTWFMSHSNELSQTLRSLDLTLGSLSGILGSVEQTELVHSVRETTDLVNANLKLIQETLKEDHLLQNIANLTANMDQTFDLFNKDGADALKNLSQLSHDLAAGTGTLGKLITGEEFYLRFNSLLSKAETLMNDINHYGLLFQYDKHWQRSRTKRANLLKALDTPKEFRSYFEGEVDSITTALGRLTELLERSDEFGKKEEISKDEIFRKQFADFLRKVDGLSSAIKLYNQELTVESSE